MEYKIGEFTERTGLSASALRYYEKEGLLRVARDEAGRRRYSVKDVEWVLFLKRLKETGMPIRRIREYAQLRAQGDSTMPTRMRLLLAHREYVRQQQAIWEENSKKLDEKIAFYRDSIAQAGLGKPAFAQAGLKWDAHKKG